MTRMTAGWPSSVHLSLRAHLVGDDVAQCVSRLFAGLEALFLHAVAQAVHQLHGDVAAHVGEDELFFQLIVKVVVDLAAGEGVQDVAPEARAGLFEAVFHFVLFFFAKSKESHGFSPFGFVCYLPLRHRLRRQLP